jgi:hypothetical protein
MSENSSSPDPNAAPPRPVAAALPRPSSLSRHWTEMVLSVTAVVIAAISLWVAIDTEYTNRQLVSEATRLVSEATWPFLQFYNSAHGREGQPELSLNVTNAGVGPAKIETLEVFWKSQSYATSKELLQACCGLGNAHAANQAAGSGDDTRHVSTSVVAQTVLRPGDSVPIIRYARTTDDAPGYAAFDSIRDHISYRVCYCSVFNECWLSDGNSLNPTRVNVCPRPARPYTE